MEWSCSVTIEINKPLWKYFTLTIWIIFYLAAIWSERVKMNIHWTIWNLKVKTGFVVLQKTAGRLFHSLGAPGLGYYCNWTVNQYSVCEQEEYQLGSLKVCQWLCSPSISGSGDSCMKLISGVTWVWLGWAKDFSYYSMSDGKIYATQIL